MKTFNGTFSSFSAERTEFSTQSQFSNTSKMIKDINFLKRKLNTSYKKKYKNNFNITHFHLNTIRTEVHRNIRYKLLLNSEQKELYTLPKFSNNDNKKKKRISMNSSINFNSKRNEPNISQFLLSNTSSNNKTNKENKTLTIPIERKKFDINSNIHKRNHTFDFLKNHTYDNKINRRNIRAESLTQFFSKTKEIFFSNYIKDVQKNEILKLNEKVERNIELFNVEISKLKRMIFLIKAYMKDENKYYEYLNKTLKKEKEICDDLIEKRNESLHETFLLRHQLNKIHRTFEKNFHNKFFLLCVKNGTNQIEKFIEEDRIDYLNDKDTLEQLSDFSLIKTKLNEVISKNDNLTNEEIEILVFGKKLIPKPKIIFSSPENFKLKLSIIESTIQLSLTQFNTSQNQLDEIRKEYLNKIDQIQEDLRIDDYYKNELINNYNELNGLKNKNKALINFKRKIPKNKKGKIKLVEKKIIEIYNEINEILPFPISSLIDKYTVITYLKEIELLINKLIKFKSDQKKYNTKEYLIIKKKIDNQNKIKNFKELKLKAQNDFDEKIKRALIKSTRLIFRPYKKVPIDYHYFLKRKKIIKKNKDDENNISLTYE